MIQEIKSRQIKNLTKVKRLQIENLFSFQSLKTTFLDFVIASVICYLERISRCIKLCKRAEQSDYYKSNTHDQTFIIPKKNLSGSPTLIYESLKKIYQSTQQYSSDMT